MLLLSKAWPRHSCWTTLYVPLLWFFQKRKKIDHPPISSNLNFSPSSQHPYFSRYHNNFSFLFFSCYRLSYFSLKFSNYPCYLCQIQRRNFYAAEREVSIQKKLRHTCIVWLTISSGVDTLLHGSSVVSCFKVWSSSFRFEISFWYFLMRDFSSNIFKKYIVDEKKKKTNTLAMLRNFHNSI